MKILEAMALGTPVVATSKGAEGLEVTSGHDILIANDPFDFAAGVAQLLRDVTLRQKLSVNGRKLVEARYDWAVLGRQWNALLEEIVCGAKADGIRSNPN